ncbi:hypothetical protein Tco_0200671 [Tanacetum coccineum]
MGRHNWLFRRNVSSQRCCLGFALQLPLHKPWLQRCHYPWFLFVLHWGQSLLEVAMDPPHSNANDGMLHAGSYSPCQVAQALCSLDACWNTRTVMVESFHLGQ